MVLKGIECDLKLLNGQIDELAKFAREHNTERIIAKLKEIVPEYKQMIYK